MKQDGLNNCYTLDIMTPPRPSLRLNRINTVCYTIELLYPRQAALDSVDVTVGILNYWLELQVGYDMTKTAAKKLFQKTGRLVRHVLLIETVWPLITQ